MANPDVAGITAPAPLRDLPAWLCWKRVLDTQTGKWRKVPMYAAGGRRQGRHGAPEDRRQLTTFDVALAAAQRRGLDGVGFALLEDWGLCAIDFDGCVADGRVVKPEVLQACEGAYVELSPSGTGLRAFVRGNFGNRKDHDFGLEVFSTAGFVTVTGRALPIVGMLGLEDAVPDAPAALRTLVARQFGREDRPEVAGGSAAPLGLNDAQIRDCLDVLDAGMRHDPWLKVGMAVHHETGGEGFDLWDQWSSRGGSYPGSAQLRSRWDSFGRGGQRPVTAHFLVRLANENGAHVDMAALSLGDFDVLEAPPGEAAAGKPDRFAVIPDTEFMARPPPKWIVKGLVPEADVLVLFGESGAGKSFVALDIFGAVARGVPWRGLKTKRVKVVYVAAEGAGGFRNRLHAYQRHHGNAPGIGVVHAAPNILQRDEVLALGKSIKAAGGAQVIVVDTLAQTTPGANENGGEDMGKALAHCRLLSRMLGDALIVLIHHAGKDASKGARGWSGLKGAADAEIEVSRTPAGRVIRASKQKDGEDGQQWGFDLVSVPIGQDEDGDVITSCVVGEAPVPAGQGLKLGRKLGRWEQHVVDAIGEIAVAQNTGIEVEAVLTLAVEKDPKPEHGRDTRRQHASRALKRLCDEPDSPYLVEDDGTLSVV